MISVHILFAGALFFASPIDAGTSPASKPAPTRSPLPARPLIDPVRNGARVDSTGIARATPSPAEPLTLKSATDGSGDLVYEGPGFVARIAGDGSVQFKDNHVSAINFLPWLPTTGPRNVPSVQSTVTELLRGKKAPAPTNVPNDTSFLLVPPPTPYRPDPREACRQCDLPPMLPLLGVSGNFDLTDEVMRLSGQDPYRSAKARFLLLTRDLRVGMAARRHAEDLRKARTPSPDAR